MAKLKIIIGDKNPILRSVSEPVKKFDGGLKKFVRDLKATMVGAKGLGIAAPQVGEPIRVFIAVFNHGTSHQVTVPMVNPEILSHGEEQTLGEEGCLSLPGIYGKVARYNRINVRYFDLDGSEQVLDLEGLNARVVQHENDHLNGVLIVDKIVGEEENLAM